MNRNHSEDRIIIAFSDLWKICKKAKRKIFVFITLGAFLAAFYALSRPIQYQSKATFKEKNSASSVVGKSVMGVLLGDVGSHDSEAISKMKSRYLMESVIKKMHMQAFLTIPQSKSNVFTKIWNNLKVFKAHRDHKEEPIFPDYQAPILVRDVTYDGEVPKYLSVSFISEDLFEVTSKGAGRSIEGKFGQLLMGQNWSFTLIKNGDRDVKGIKGQIVIYPLASLADQFAKSIKIEVDKKDKTLLKLQYSHPDRHVASEILNQVMQEFQNTLKDERDRHAKIQLAYLQKRQDESLFKLKKLMEDHANSLLAADMSELGLAEASQELEFLAKRQAECKERVFSTEMESRRIECLRNKGVVDFSHCSFIDDPSLATLLSSMRALTQKQDALSLAVRQTQRHKEHESDLRENCAKQIEELEKIRNLKEQAQIFLTLLNRADQPVTIDSSLSTHDLVMDFWEDKLKTFKARWDQEEDTPKLRNEWKVCKENCLSYLQNLLRLYIVHESILAERVSHQCIPQPLYQGLDLKTAQNMHVDFSQQLQSLESETLQLNFILEQLQEPQFEVSSLSYVIHDSVTQSLIAKTSDLSLQLRDQNNRSLKELDRIKEELMLQKEFLTAHLKESLQLLQLRSHLIQEKIEAIQSVTLDLVNQELSISSKQLADYLDSRTDQLQEERSVIEQHLTSLQKAMTSLPQKWVSEQLIKQYLLLHKGAVEEITKMVEAKNIGHNLDVIQSAPLDAALPPLLPTSPPLFLFGILGGIVAGFFVLGFELVAAIVKGVEASSANLTLANQHVAGEMTSRANSSNLETLVDGDLATLRRLQFHLCREMTKSHGKSTFGLALLMIVGRGPDYSKSFVHLLAIKGYRVLLMDLSFSGMKQTASEEGLWGFLNGSVSSLSIHKNADYDVVEVGGMSRVALELLTSLKFQEQLRTLKGNYDVILAITDALPESAEAEGLLRLFDGAAITITGQKLHELSFYLKGDLIKKVSFVMSV